MQQLAELNNRRKALEAKLPSTDAEVVVQHPHAAARLQHDARPEYCRRQAVARGDRGLRRPDCTLCIV
jgi:hypothetical protein